MPMPFTAQAFPLGRTVITPAALALLEEIGVSPLSLLHRHAHGDWGEVDADDQIANDHALILNEGRLFSDYLIDQAGGHPPVRVWVITEEDRSSTVVLLPKDY